MTALQALAKRHEDTVSLAIAATIMSTALAVLGMAPGWLPTLPVAGYVVVIAANYIGRGWR